MPTHPLVLMVEVLMLCGFLFQWQCLPWVSPESASPLSKRVMAPEKSQIVIPWQLSLWIPACESLTGCWCPTPTCASALAHSHSSPAWSAAPGDCGGMSLSDIVCFALVFPWQHVSIDLSCKKWFHHHVISFPHRIVHDLVHGKNTVQNATPGQLIGWIVPWIDHLSPHLLSFFACRNNVTRRWLCVGMESYAVTAHHVWPKMQSHNFWWLSHRWWGVGRTFFSRVPVVMARYDLHNWIKTKHRVDLLFLFIPLL